MVTKDQRIVEKLLKQGQLKQTPNGKIYLTDEGKTVAEGALKLYPELKNIANTLNLPDWNLENFAKFWENIDYEIASKEKFNAFYDEEFYEEDSEAFPEEEHWEDEDDFGDEEDW